jgi:hypothetical protein
VSVGDAQPRNSDAKSSDRIKSDFSSLGKGLLPVARTCLFGLSRQQGARMSVRI